MAGAPAEAAGLDEESPGGADWPGEGGAAGGSRGAEAEAAEVLGGSSSDEDMTVDDLGREEVFREGAEVVVLEGAGGPEGRRGTLVRWEDVGGIFGQWVVRVEAIGGGPAETLRLPPGQFCLASDYDGGDAL
mmetsp:Transcript_82860/g.256116  ORF Transcript_82860/g.256116 Transcript_82860/m.256116 type:complete len:132 (+) Transcript_82860:1-396(+)